MTRKGFAMWLGVGLLAAGLLAASGGALARAVRLRQARHDVRVLWIALEGYAREQGRYPEGTLAEICALLRGAQVRGQNPGGLDYVEAAPHEMNAAGEFVDPWGTPYRVVVDGAPRVWSCGPNRVDEQGEGDDIASWR